MAHYEIAFKNIEQDKSEMLIALLSEKQFEGFEENDHMLKAYVNESVFNMSEIETLIGEFDVEFDIQKIEETNWNEKWESGFDPIDVMHPETGKLFAHVRASFHQPDPDAIHDLIITPKMSFGTGHHATTFQMMEMMSTIDFAGKHVIDFGTGTGLLSILAEKMGAFSIKAIDNDDWSINNTIENVAANACGCIEVVKAEHCLVFENKADIILANINLNVILANLKLIKDAGKKGSIILFSGILVDDEPMITKSLYEHGFEITEIKSRNNWLVLRSEIR